MSKDIVECLRGAANEIARDGHAGWGNQMTDAADEIERLNRAIDRLIGPNLVSIAVRNGGLDLAAEGIGCRLLAESFASDFQRGGGVNYIECRFTSQEVMPGEAIVVTVQRVHGQTPHQLREQAERELYALRARIEAAPVIVYGRDCDCASPMGGIHEPLIGKRVRLVAEEG